MRTHSLHLLISLIAPGQLAAHLHNQLDPLTPPYRANVIVAEGDDELVLNLLHAVFGAPVDRSRWRRLSDDAWGWTLMLAIS